MATPSFSSRVRGCLLGGALGNALGYAVESDSVEQIKERFGRQGLRDFSQLTQPVPFSDDTQLTLFTVDGLVEAVQWANEGVPADEAACLWLAYLRWLGTQDEPIPAGAPAPPPAWLDRQPGMRHRRSPGHACLSGLASGEMGTTARPVNPAAKGCGTVTRSAPFGLVPYLESEAIYALSVKGAALTHGHPAALQGAGGCSLIVHHLVHDGGSLAAAAEAAAGFLEAVPAPDGGLLEALTRALQLAQGPALDPEQIAVELGTGQVAEEALAIGLYAALAAGAAGSATEHFRAGVVLALNHGGYSASTAAITGSLLGALLGEEALPAEWLEALDGREIVAAMADSLITATGSASTGPAATGSASDW